MARLKLLVINGFKSFANPTTFAFDDGVTAIVGPNGSGKSNVSEALRWVLGEQQYSNLRSRRTEDIIFGGSDQRGRMGLAEVSLTIDNSSGLLPIEFSEINVTRRAHRSGENQYLINGNRVRLRDVQQLTAPLGQSHTIVGQGLVDAVLSQRPEDRRGLFEHAAGITGLRMQTVSAERGLREAEENVQRLTDIIGELEPRVRSLARRARQAQQYESVRSELISMQRGYYGALWLNAQERLKQAEIVHQTTAAAVKDQEDQLAAIQSKLTGHRQRERDIANAKADLVEQASAVETKLSAARHRLDLIQAEFRSIQERADDRLRAKERFEAEQAERNLAIDSSDQQIARLQAEFEQLKVEHEQQAASHADSQRQRLELEQQLKALNEDRQKRVETIARLNTSIAGQTERRGILNRSKEAIEIRLESLNKRVTGLEQDIDRSERELVSAQQALQEVRNQRDTLDRALDTVERDLRQKRSEAEEQRRDLDRMRGRLELLERIWAEGEGLHAGVRSIIQAIRHGNLELPGMIGTVAESIDVPAGFEIAIEVALGGHLQDIIVGAWGDAESGIQYLKSTSSGRARFQPLDSIRRYRKSRLNDSPAGLIGQATELITFADEIEPVINQLLGRTVIVEDLKAAQNIRREFDGWTIVTLQGELVATTGSVTGGARVRGAGLLARERERRELPARIENAEQQANANRDAVRNVQQRQTRDVEQLEQFDAELVEARNQVRLTREHQVSRQREIDLELVNISQQSQELEVLQTDLDRITSDTDSVVSQRDEISDDLATIESARAAVVDQLNSIKIPDDASLHVLATELATIQERIRSAERERSVARDQIERANRENAARADELARIDDQQMGLESERKEIEASVEKLSSELEELRSKIPPVNEQLELVRASIGSIEQRVEHMTRDLRDGERLLSQASLDVARAGDGVELLRSRILDDLETNDPEILLENATEASEDVEQGIRRLRERLRRMGAVGDDVIEEYDDESERLNYLSSQLNDVERAAGSLREVLTNLHRQMGARFDETFAEVAREFEATFTRLFGGGSARLSHEADGSDPGGIDIVARPPGKRLQGLNQLSGGERALTAVSLLIAIQRVNPSPFCLLDEVDAALDESNVIRFRQELRELAKDTQYIVITHNRGTIEGADALYGITMGTDSVSRVISLRLDEAIQVVKDDQLLEMESVI